MSNQAWLWLLATLVAVFIQGISSMLEMSAISFNRVRLQYLISQGHPKALQLYTLLQHPSRLFGTTLITLNLALQVGSQCSREFYTAAGLSPNYAAITQVFLVLIFAELSPMFAARAHPEHVAMLGIPLLYRLAKLFAPIVHLIGVCTRAINHLATGNKHETQNIYLTREEIQKILEKPVIETDQKLTTYQQSARIEFNRIVGNIFVLEGECAIDLMHPFSAETLMVDYYSTVEDLRQHVTTSKQSYAFVYQSEESRVVGIVLVRDLVKLPPEAPIRNHLRLPAFANESTPIMTLLHQFRHKNLPVATVIDANGHATGYIALDDVLDSIFI